MIQAAEKTKNLRAPFDVNRVPGGKKA